MDLDPSTYQFFLAEFIPAISHPQDGHLATRCWSKGALNALVAKIRDRLESRSVPVASLTTKNVVAALEQSGLARQVDIMPVSSASAAPKLYILDVAPAESPIFPVELLQAAQPSGVVCYLTAIIQHGLTTQPPTHHHIAVPHQGSAKPEADPARDRPQKLSHSSSTRSSLGTALFSYQDLPYYYTKRAAHLIPGVQVRELAPRIQFRITTLEQTLLDTLYKPFHCGGPSIIFEAWEEAMPKVDEERMAVYLGAMRYPALTRRLGTMLEVLGHKPATPLAAVLEKARQEINPDDPYVRISLLPGVPYASTNMNWLVGVP